MYAACLAWLLIDAWYLLKAACEVYASVNTWVKVTPCTIKFVIWCFSHKVICRQTVMTFSQIYYAQCLLKVKTGHISDVLLWRHNYLLRCVGKCTSTERFVPNILNLYSKPRDRLLSQFALWCSTAFFSSHYFLLNRSFSEFYSIEPHRLSFRPPWPHTSEGKMQKCSCTKQWVHVKEL